MGRTTNRQQKTSALLRAAVAALVIALLGTACGDSGGDSSADTSVLSRPDGDRRNDDRAATTAASSETTSAPATTAAESGGRISRPATTVSDSVMTTTTYAAESQEEPEVGDFERTSRQETSTFALDVDTASYTFARRAVFDGFLPDPNTVRVEEFVNSFAQDYAAPSRDTFAIYADGAPHELVDDNTYVLRVGIASREVSDRRRPDANLTFVVDVSGSMKEEGKMELVKDSLHLLVDELDNDDRIAIVAYDDRAWVVLEPTFVDRSNDIHDAIDRLRPGGSTNVDAGLQLGYELARDTFDEGLVNRVILASDGVANRGNTDPERILADIAEDAGNGIQMLAVGYGFGSYNDDMLERLANSGNGVYAYVDTIDEAERLFSDQLTSTLVTVALDAKVQIEFNADSVRSWRLLGFENRALSERDFNDPGIDAGEIGSGHTVTALYEIDLARGVEPGDNDVLGTVHLKWIDPNSQRSEDTQGQVRATALDSSLRRATPHLRWDIAVATTAELLRRSEWVAHVDPEDVFDELVDVARDLRTDEADEFVDFFDIALALGL